VKTAKKIKRRRSDGSPLVRNGNGEDEGNGNSTDTGHDTVHNPARHVAYLGGEMPRFNRRTMDTGGACTGRGRTASAV
jgi:hypothetical protein